MTISNHITLADIHRMPVGQIAARWSSTVSLCSPVSGSVPAAWPVRRPAAMRAARARAVMVSASVASM